MLVENFKIRWNYENNTTSCVIATVENQPVVTATIKRFVRDVDNKRLARKIALTQAMRMAKENNLIQKPVRMAIWEQFRTTINQPIIQK